jgi:uncharacterized RDD family membrane protein YckC
MSESPHEDPVLFDLPMAPAAGGTNPPARRSHRSAAERPESLPLFTDEELAGGEPPEDSEPERVAEPPHVYHHSAVPVEHPRPVALPPPGPEPETAPLAARLRASAGDLIVIAAVATTAIAGAGALGAPVALDEMPAVAVFLLAWSFVYCVVSLAFWGQTPGMAWAGLVARAARGEPLSFGQTVRRWAATWLTWALAGLPGLLALTGRSLADRLSASRTYPLSTAI